MATNPRDKVYSILGLVRRNEGRTYDDHDPDFLNVGCLMGKVVDDFEIGANEMVLLLIVTSGLIMTVQEPYSLDKREGISHVVNFT